jgi:DNA-binding CsgD family transcriptional regulator
MTTDDGTQPDHEVERSIARLIVAGHKDQSVARALHMSTRTLHRVLERLLHRHGLPNRAALGAYAASRGWLSNFTPPGAAEDHAGPDGDANGGSARRAAVPTQRRPGGSLSHPTVSGGGSRFPVGSPDAVLRDEDDEHACR